MDLNYSLRRRVVTSIVTLGIVLPIAIFFFLQYFFFRSFAKANIRVDVRKVISPLHHNWNALAQGGEESGVRMIQNVIPQTSELQPRYIRIDHIYDFYNVVSYDASGNLSFSWGQLDNTVCDIYASGAKPFFVLGYMPSIISSDGTPTGQPINWNDWRLVVQKTIERYSGKNTALCSNLFGDQFTSLYYEVWNEPDLESFGNWSIEDGKDYRLLYRYASQGAQQAQNVNEFLLGGPATTAAYRNWFQKFLDYVLENNLRIDFISWHHYTNDPTEFISDVEMINSWLPKEAYERYHNLPKIISEWGYDTEYNQAEETNVGAAHTVASVRNFIDQKIEYAFTFELKDGRSPSHGILANDGSKKPRYEALKMLNSLEGYRIVVDGEGEYVKAIASRTNNKTVLVLTNYDREGRNEELVPISFSGLPAGRYRMHVTNLGGITVTSDTIETTGADLTHNVFMPANHVAVIELTREQ